MKLGIVFKEGNEKAAGAVGEVKKYLTQKGVEVLEGEVKGADYILSFGGDGTLIHKACEFAELEIPIIGINVGRLGFLTAAEFSKWKEAVDLLLAGKVFVSERITIEARIESKSQRDPSIPLRASKEPEVFRAVNELVVKGLYRIIQTEIAIHAKDLLTFAGDGVIIATQTGSTAYSLSSGGPIVDPDLNCFLLTPVNPIGLPIPSVVVSPDEEILVKIVSGDDISLIIDGQEHTKVVVGDVIRVARGKHNVKFGYFTEDHFTESLNSKFELAKRSG